MFRHLLLTSAIALAAPAYADTFTADAEVDAVIIFPGLASVTRQVFLQVPAGRHDVVIPGLPQGISTEGLRVGASGGAQIGAVNLAFDRLPVTPDLSAPEIVAARAEVARLEEVLRASAARIAEIRLRVDAAEEQVRFLQGLATVKTAEGLGAATDIAALAQMLGAEVLAARQAGFAAEQEALAADRARREDIEALAEAKQALAALTTPEDEGAVLTFTLTAAAESEITIDITTLEGFANWQPVYDMRLTTGDAPRLDIDRAVVISQASGQDWTDVQLTLSTARPGGQTGPSGVWPMLRRIVPEDEIGRPLPLAEGLAVESRAFADMAIEEVAAEPITAQADFSGAVVTYVYPTRVTIRDGVEDLRLPLDRLSLEAEVWAEAVPSRDSIAYRMAAFTNSSEELLLPGRAVIYADDTMLGFSHLPLLAAGADTKMGFGPLDGLRLTRTMPERMEGDRGVFTTTNELRERATLTVENLTGQDWDVLLRDAVPYSEQENLEVALSASPVPTRRDVDGQRGVLEWDFRLPAGDAEVISLDYTLSWPEGYILR